MFFLILKVEYCEFPEDVYYDVSNDVWFRPSTDGSGGTMGMTTVLSFLAGRLQNVKLRTENRNVSQNQALATIESSKYFGAVRSPVSGRVKEFNSSLITDPKLANRDPYGEGWIAKYESFDSKELAKLIKGSDAAEALRERIKELKVRCFAELPEEEMFSIGTECSTTLANLNQILQKGQAGMVVHLVTDDPTAEIEMIRWAEITKNEILEERKEGNLFHFIVKKV